MIRAALYHRTSAADAGSPPGEALEELRRYASRRAWCVVGEHVDHHPRHDGPRPELELLAGRVAAGEVDVVLVASLHRLFRDLRSFAATGRQWLSRGTTVVAIAESLDGTAVDGGLLLRGALELMHALEHRRHSEATRVGTILRGAEGRLGWRIPVNKLEVKTLYEDGTNGRYLSARKIVAEIKRAGGRMSEGTLRKVLREMREAGMLDEGKRRELAARTHARHRGGRPAVRLVYDPIEIATLLANGCGADRIKKLATSLPRGTTTWRVRRIIAEVRASARPIPSETPGTPARESGNPKAPEGGGGSRISAAAGADPAEPGPRARRCLGCGRELGPRDLACPSCSSARGRAR